MLETIKEKTKKYKYQISGAILLSILSGTYYYYKTRFIQNEEIKTENDIQPVIKVKEMKEMKEVKPFEEIETNQLVPIKKNVKKKKIEKLPMYENTGYKDDIKKRQIFTMLIVLCLAGGIAINNLIQDI